MKTWSWRRGRPGGPWPWESFVDFFWLKTWRQPADRHHLCMWHSAGSHQDQVLLCPFLFWPSKSRSVQSEVWRVYDCTLVLHGKLREWTLRKKSKSKPGASHSRLQDTKWMEWKKQSISFLTHRGVAKFPDIALAIPTCDRFEAVGALTQNRFFLWLDPFGCEWKTRLPPSMTVGQVGHHVPIIKGLRPLPPTPGREWGSHSDSTSHRVDCLAAKITMGSKKSAAVVYVQFQTTTTWQIQGVPDANVYPVSTCRRVWYLDRQRRSPKLRVARTQFPPAPQFAITAHVAQGQTTKEGVYGFVHRTDRKSIHGLRRHHPRPRSWEAANFSTLRRRAIPKRDRPRPGSSASTPARGCDQLASVAGQVLWRACTFRLHRA